MTDTPTPRDAHRCPYEGTIYECDFEPCQTCQAYRIRTLERDLSDTTADMLRIHNEKVDHFEARIKAERDLSECRAALRELHDDIQGRIDDGAKFNPGTLHALSAARAILQSDEGETK